MTVLNNFKCLTFSLDNRIKEIIGLDASKLTRLHTLELRGNKLVTTDGIYLPKLQKLYLVCSSSPSENVFFFSCLSDHYHAQEFLHKVYSLYPSWRTCDPVSSFRKGSCSGTLTPLCVYENLLLMGGCVCELFSFINNCGRATNYCDFQLPGIFSSFTLFVVLLDYVSLFVVLLDYLSLKYY